MLDGAFGFRNRNHRVGLLSRAHGKLLQRDREGYGRLPGMNRKRYSPPALRNLTPGQAMKIIADGKNCNEEEAAEILESLQRERSENHQKRNEPLTANQEQVKKRSA